MIWTSSQGPWCGASHQSLHEGCGPRLAELAWRWQVAGARTRHPLHHHTSCSTALVPSLSLHRRASPPRFTAALALPNAPLAPHATPPSASSFTSLISSTATGSGCSHGCFGGMGGRGVV